MNAWATWWMGTWLMGECTVNDVVLGNTTAVTQLKGAQSSSQILLNQGVLVQRCRFLENSGCASVCVNSCKLPTQTFFREQMGIPVSLAGG
jgi:Beta-carotene isomerase D27-like, C-terminal